MIKLFYNFKNIFLHYNELLLNITLREIKVKYKQSVLGFVWALLQPLSMMAIFTVIFSYFMKIPSDGVPYPIFSFAGLLPWTFFSSALAFAIPSVVSNNSLVTKIYLPREIFPIASVLSAFFDFCIASILFCGMLIFYKIPLTVNVLYLIPILLLQIMLILGVAFFFSAVIVYYRDVKYIVPLLTQLWMYISPIIYPVSIVPNHLRPFYMLNPMAPIIDGYRRVLLQGAAPDLFYLGIAAIVIIILLFFSYNFFKKFEMSFADVI